jgi:hypothetical protein
MPDEVRALKTAGELPDTVKLNETEDNGEDNFEFGSGGEEVRRGGRFFPLQKSKSSYVMMMMMMAWIWLCALFGKAGFYHSTGWKKFCVRWRGLVTLQESAEESEEDKGSDEDIDDI